MDIHNRLKESRNRAGLTQGQVAAYEGVSQSYVANLESGSSTPNVWPLLARLAQRYRTSADYLLGLTDDPRPLAKILEHKEALAAIGDQGLQWLAIYDRLSAEDQLLVETMMVRLDEQRQLVEDVRVAMGLVDLAGRLGGVDALDLARRIMDGELEFDEVLAQLG